MVSFDTCFTADETELIGRVEERIARWTMTDAGQGEGIQVLRYDVRLEWHPLPL